jgi:hypothetical protein
MDISDRMQCPPDFVAIPAMVALGSVIGRKVSLRPQRKTDWYEVPNLWGCIVGRPGAMKSPAMDEALKPLHRLEAEARKANEAAAKDYEIEVEEYRKLVPALALINHLVEGATGAISETAILRALAFADYLGTHARRAYGAGSEVETSAAKAILAKVRKGDLADGFTARDIHQHGWSNLSDREHV